MYLNRHRHRLPTTERLTMLWGDSGWRLLRSEFSRVVWGEGEILRPRPSSLPNAWPKGLGRRRELAWSRTVCRHKVPLADCFYGCSTEVGHHFASNFSFWGCSHVCSLTTNKRAKKSLFMKYTADTHAATDTDCPTLTGNKLDHISSTFRPDFEQTRP